MKWPGFNLGSPERDNEVAFLSVPALCRGQGHRQRWPACMFIWLSLALGHPSGQCHGELETGCVNTLLCHPYVTPLPFTPSQGLNAWQKWLWAENVHFPDVSTTRFVFLKKKNPGILSSASWGKIDVCCTRRQAAGPGEGCSDRVAGAEFARQGICCLCLDFAES